MQGSLQPASNSSPQFLLLRVIITLQADHDTRDTIIHLSDDWEHEAGNCSNFIILDILSWLHWSLVTMLQFSAMIRMSSCSDLHKHMIISVRLCSYKLPTIETNPETHVTEDHQPDDNLYNCTQYQLSLACFYSVISSAGEEASQVPTRIHDHLSSNVVVFFSVVSSVFPGRSITSLSVSNTRLGTECWSEEVTL